MEDLAEPGVVWAVLLELPIEGLIVKLSEKIIPILPEENRRREDRQLVYMVANGGLPSSLALHQARLEISRMGEMAVECLSLAANSFFAQNDAMAEQAMDLEDAIDVLTDKIQGRLIELKAMDYSNKVMEEISHMILITTDIERISDHGRNIAEYTEQYKVRKAKISEIGMKELRSLADLSIKTVDFSLSIFRDEAYNLIPEAARMEQNVDDLQLSIVNAHIDRLMHSSCDPVGGVIFNDLASDLERCADHAMNVASALSSLSILTK